MQKIERSLLTARSCSGQTQFPESVTLKDNWCWEQNFINVNVGAEDVEGILFVQKGYLVNVISTHNVDGYLTQPGSIGNLKIQKGSEHICVEHPGLHEFSFVDSCIFFGSSSVKINTATQSVTMPRREVRKVRLAMEVSEERRYPMEPL
ncbi:hypothetical protein LR48_Vigan02g146300 [Vigna angularis]|uniref:NOMO seventh transthyretin-like domain-containing protein n=1 Tax=Phaseolus angularis TaxID=3914 RepID=A0A0L9TXK0_PHAAN|nr:hypothetical protein LR48_Vigan02g146300 [Vigna angularis]